MSLIKWSNLDDAFPSLPTVLEDFFGRDSYSRSLGTGVNVPAVNIKEEDDKFLITLAVPGLKKEDCKVQVENGMLTISSQKKDEKKDERGKYSRYEYNFSSFSRSFSLPDNVDTESITAKYEDGELKIELQKKEKSLPSGREIAIE